MALKIEKTSTEKLNSLQQIKQAAGTLNAATDRFSKVILEIEEFLKTLNIGVACWVTIPGTEWADEQTGASGFNQLGYSKVNGKWGFALSSFNDYADEPDVWAFHDSSRDLRLKSVACLPLLLDELANGATKLSHDVDERTHEVEQLVAALKGRGSL